MSDIKSSVSIVIPHWNNVDVLSECLESILNTDFENFETIVVDNASTDNSVASVRSNYPNVKLIENDKNYGYAGGCNIGAEAASGDFLIFLNNDTVQEKDWISNLIKTINSDDKIAAVQPKILNYYDRNVFDYAGGSGGHMDIYCFPFARGRIFSFQENDEGQYNNKEKCFWSSGTCFMVRRELFQKAGGFDDSFFAHMEEIDLCWRAFNNNIEIWQPEKISNKEVSIVKELSPDIIIVVSYGLLIPKEILSIPKLGCINVHPSLLPRWRGAAPIQRSIESGDTITGITIMMMNEKLDTGDIIYQEPHRIDSHKKAWELEEELMNLGGHILLLALESILNLSLIHI